MSSLALVSLALASLPWLLPAPAGLVVGVLLHLGWFAACERFGRSPLQAAAGASAPPAKAASSAGSGASRPSSRAPSASPAAPRGFVQTPILATVDDGPDIKTLRLARPDGFTFEAGQFIPVRLRVDGAEYVRCYSISSSPFTPGYLEISVKRQGLVSNALHATARPGAILSIKAPNGAFRYPAGDDRPIVLIAGGVGITPLMSMLRRAVHSEPSRPVTLVYGARDEKGLVFRDELMSMAARHPQVRVCFALSRATGSVDRLTMYPGRIDAALLTAAVPDLLHSIAFICGPTAMIEDMKRLLAGLGMPAPQIRAELFEAAVAAAAGVRESAPEGAAAPGAEGLRMRCLPADVSVPVGRGQSLLEAAESGGVEVPSLCRAGVCGTCRIRVAEGSVDCESTTLDAADVSDGYVLACVSMARSDCTVEI